MADRKKFEEMLERLINEDRDGAEAIFHELVVEKSREIYETLLEDDADIDDEVDEASKDEEEDEDKVDESSEEDDDEETNEDFNLDEFEVEADPMAQMGGDPADDMMGDIGSDEEGEDDMGGEGDVEDRVEDLEDALEDLKAEFEKLMAGEDGEDMGDDDMDMGGDDDMDDMGGDEEAPEKESTAAPYTAKITPLSAGEQMREYVEKVSPKMGDNGANTKSTVASKNDMGGTAKNLTQAGTEKSPVEANKGQLKGNGLLKGSEKDMSTGNINVPGGKAAKANKPMPKGHGAEKRGAGDTATNKKSIIGSK
jgi:hypothetical protein